jgi:hypothetical protein
MMILSIRSGERLASYFTKAKTDKIEADYKNI